MKKLTATVAGVAIALAIVPAAHASTSGTDARCYFETVLHQSYGLTLERHSSNFVSDKAPIACEGTIDGAAITGEGTTWFTGQAETSCLEGTGTLQIGVQIPTENGQVTMTGKGSFTRVGLVGESEGVFNDGSAFIGPFVPQPIDGGDCRTKPVKDVLIRHWLHLSNA